MGEVIQLKQREVVVPLPSYLSTRSPNLAWRVGTLYIVRITFGLVPNFFFFIFKNADRENVLSEDLSTPIIERHFETRRNALQTVNLQRWLFEDSHVQFCFELLAPFLSWWGSGITSEAVPIYYNLLAMLESIR